jgi:hypothetical protein
VKLPADDPVTADSLFQDKKIRVSRQKDSFQDDEWLALLP